ncbi:MAG: SDR family oxidoreductase [Candidatus Thermoplasmatota archaeon]|nr:SDR family oxidoreductase [Candidatus Thermoplasmatota archaeon]
MVAARASMDLLGEQAVLQHNALEGKTALICGASRGIGAATARIMAKAGANVIIASRNKEQLSSLLDELPLLGNGEHEALVMDLENTESIQQSIQPFLDKGPIHILVNNAGGPPGGPLLNATVDELAQPFTRHLHAAHTLVKLLTPGMILANYGRIIQIVSTSVREPIPNLGVSNTLRGAMASWAKSLSRELHPCITINNVLPGFTDTERLGSLAQSIHEKTGQSIESIHNGWMSQVPIERLIDPLETASTIAFLASPAAGAIRGVSLPVDGGRLRSI